MLKTCPHCLTLVEVTDEQLSNSDSSVVCTHCRARFNIEMTPTQPASPEPPAPDIIIEDDDRVQMMQAELKSGRSKKQRRIFPWLIINLFLALLLMGQYIYFQRDKLTEDPTLRPWLIQFCQYLHCELKLIRDTQQIHIISREVKTHETLKNTLQISMTFINDAPFKQPWPTIKLSFSSLNGQVIAERAFVPGNYLSTSEQISRGLPPGQPFTADLLLIDPGPEAVNFVFEFQ